MYTLELWFDRNCYAFIQTPWYCINRNGSVSFEGCECCWPNKYRVEYKNSLEDDL